MLMDEPLYPPDLVKPLRDAAERLANMTTPRSWPPLVVLPDDAILRRLLNVCYHAGLLREESRLLSFCVIFAPKSNPPEDPTLHTVAFVEPLPFNEQQIRRLAPATAPDSTAIVVRLMPS